MRSRSTRPMCHRHRVSVVVRTHSHHAGVRLGVHEASTRRTHDALTRVAKPNRLGYAGRSGRIWDRTREGSQVPMSWGTP
jgi:hypothetical protein